MVMRGTEKRGKVAVAGVLLFCFGALTVGAERMVQPNSVPRRRVLRGPDNDWPRYCASNSMNGVALGEQVLAAATVANLRLLWSRALNGPVASAPSVARGKV